MKVYLKTYGCQANISDSEAIAGILKQKNHELVDNIDNADVVIANTCSVKSKTQNRILSFLKSVPKDKKLAVGGCLTKTIDIRKYADVDIIFDTNSILKVPELIETGKDSFSGIKEERLNVPVIRSKKDIGIIVIEQGCTSNCSFCATKLARGNLKSYRIGDIKRAMERALDDGCKKIYLSGQDTGCYGFDIKTNLPELLKELTSVEGDYKIRVGMMNPWHVKKILNELIEAYKNEKIIKFLHIPVQSGSEKVVRDMKRIHSVKDFMVIANKFRNEFKDITIATDIIVGYPSETEEDFEKTLGLIREIKPEVLNISMYSIRQGTYSSNLKPLKTEEVKRRSRILTEEYRKIKNHKVIFNANIN